MTISERSGPQTSIRIDGVLCACCGDTSLRVIVLDTDPDGGALTLGWCCVEHAQRAGWPWLSAESAVCHALKRHAAREARHDPHA